jgi:hypothetical protein
MNARTTSEQRRPPVERRPADNPSEAKRLAIKSYREQQAREAEARSAKPRASSPPTRPLRAGRSSSASSEAIAAMLRTSVEQGIYERAARASLLRHPRDRALADARGSAAVARAHASRSHPGSDAHTDGDPPPYTDKEVEALGRQGLALTKRRGPGYHYPIKNRRDLLAAIAAVGRAPESERAAVKQWIRKRATVMGLQNELPPNW